MKKWNHEIRTRLYRALKNEFGPFSEWLKREQEGGSLRPSKLVEFYQKFADSMKLEGIQVEDGGPRNQVEFLITKQESFTRSHIQTWVLNTAAALEVGFIENRHLPEIILK